MEKILISACLIGKHVRYDGKVLPHDSPIFEQWKKAGRIVPVCPEVDAGMTVPRTPCEIFSGDGFDVISGKTNVYSKNGINVTEYFLKGANIALTICNKYDIRVALLAELSPSCGSRMIYDGSFLEKKIEGVGVTTALLQLNKIRVFNQFEVTAANEALN
jgi:uncharacterized protein YbbK (DUF523 family)